jgi:pimeloyl-ACP methyl ester carboxylesterase
VRDGGPRGAREGNFVRVNRPTHLLLLPGMDGTEVFFRPLLRELPRWIEPRVVTYPVAGRNDYATLFEEVRAAAAELDECFVLGWSFSGPLALELAAREPAKVRGVVLAATFVRAPLRRLEWLEFLMVGPLIWLVRGLRRLPLYLSRRAPSQWKRDKRETWRRVPAATLARRARAILKVDARERARTCRAPVLYLAGTRDTVVPHRNVEEIVRELPATAVVPIEGEHLALYSNPEAAARAIASWIEGTAGRAATGGARETRGVAP